MTQIKTLVLASKNDGKIREIKALLEPLNIQLLSGKDINIPDVNETSGTFIGNAKLKSQSAFKATGHISLADDSGLCINALKGLPGVDTAYFGGLSKVIEELIQTPKNQRQAHFICVLSLTLSENETIYFQGKAYGCIAMKELGENGFGYDNIFIPEGYTETYAQMTSESKNAMSARSQVLAKLIEFLK